MRAQGILFLAHALISLSLSPHRSRRSQLPSKTVLPGSERYYTATHPSIDSMIHHVSHVMSKRVQSPVTGRVVNPRSMHSLCIELSSAFTDTGVSPMHSAYQVDIAHRDLVHSFVSTGWGWIGPGCRGCRGSSGRRRVVTSPVIRHLGIQLLCSLLGSSVTTTFGLGVFASASTFGAVLGGGLLDVDGRFWLSLGVGTGSGQWFRLIGAFRFCVRNTFGERLRGGRLRDTAGVNHHFDLFEVRLDVVKIGESRWCLPSWASCQRAFH